jgi:hypothetical protein
MPEASMLLKLTASFLILTSTSAASTDAVPASFIGRWRLSDIECVNGNPGELVRAQKAGLSKGAEEDYFLINASTVEHHLIERKNRDSLGAFCETVFKGTWSIRGNVIKKPSLNFESRSGHGGYVCYRPFDTKTETGDRDWPFTVDKSQLKIRHKDLVVNDLGQQKIQHECETGSDVTLVYQKEL